ncbi:MAG: hypothetical protein ACE5HT_06530 [Gemmatimonadales bacterium]
MIYQSERPVFDLYWRAADASQSEEPLLVDEYDKNPGSISPDGKTLAVSRAVPRGNVIWLVPLDAGEPTSYLETQFSLVHPSFSPDGGWMAYDSDESGRREVYLQSYPDPAIGRVQVSTDGDTEPMWTKGGVELVYRNGDAMMATKVDLSTGEANTPHRLFTGRYVGWSSETGNTWSYDVTPDGSRFLLIKTPAESAPRRINIVVNWFEELRVKVGSN